MKLNNRYTLRQEPELYDFANLEDLPNALKNAYIKDVKLDKSAEITQRLVDIVRNAPFAINPIQVAIVYYRKHNENITVKGTSQRLNYETRRESPKIKFDKKKRLYSWI